MLRTLFQTLRTGVVTQRALFPDLPIYNRGLPQITTAPCQASDGCTRCVETCPTTAIDIIPVSPTGQVTLDLGRCIACGGCTTACPTGTLTADRRTTVAGQQREALVLRNYAAAEAAQPAQRTSPASGSAPESTQRLFRRSLHIRVVSTGDNATDLEVAATNNPIFDASRFGIHFVASPRFADALLVTGPVALAMQEPLRRCYAAMAEPRLVIAVGAAAIAGGLHDGSYAQATGVNTILPVAVYVPGHPPHPWSILHGILLAMGHPRAMASAREGQETRPDGPAQTRHRSAPETGAR